VSSKQRLWSGVALVAVTLLLLPFALSYAGTAWVRSPA